MRKAASQFETFESTLFCRAMTHDDSFIKKLQAEQNRWTRVFETQNNSE